MIIDGVNRAKSGHPGGAMGSMDFVTILYRDFLSFDPEDPKWMGRDRFVLSAGHMSMQLYAILHANGWLDKTELENFRQLGSLTPGHPENHLTPGVECTTGPLGQGAAMSVGMAMASKHHGASLSNDLFNKKTYVLVGDGCMQEDITLGSASIAGHLGLDNLIWFYDKNRKQISGDINRVSSDDEKKIFEGFGWEVIEIDGYDHGAIEKSLAHSRKEGRQKPLLIIGNTIIAKGAKTLEGEHKTHGAPLPADELAATKEALGIPEGKEFYISSESLNDYRKNFPQKSNEAKKWRETLESKLNDKDFRQKYDGYFSPNQNLSTLEYPADSKEATRNSFGRILEKWSHERQDLMGGSADLEPSNMTGGFAKAVGDFQKTSYQGRNIAFGVREFPMSAICNGMALHGGMTPFDATFLSFSDYSRAALRLGALQEARVIHEFSHDSFMLGEDGPTHQPIEHVMSLRTIPQFYVMRPCDGKETEEMMRVGFNHKFPSALILTRQKLPQLVREQHVADIKKGAYILHDVKDPDTIIFATGSEVELAMNVAKSLSDHKTRVVSIPCWKLFFEQEKSYKEKVLGREIKQRVSIEAGTTLGWERFVGDQGLMIGIDHFGESAPAADLAHKYGFTAEQIKPKIENYFS